MSIKFKRTHGGFLEGVRTLETGISGSIQDAFAVTTSATVTKTYTNMRTVAFQAIGCDVRMAIDPDADVSESLPGGKWYIIYDGTTFPLGVFEEGNTLTVKFRANDQSGNVAVIVLE